MEETCNEKMRKKVDIWLFVWIVGAIALLASGCYGFVWVTNRDTQQSIAVMDARYAARFKVIEEKQNKLQVDNAVRDQQYKTVLDGISRIEGQQAVLLDKIEKLRER